MFEVLITLLFVVCFYLISNIYLLFLLVLLYFLLVLPGIYSLIFGAPYLPSSDKRIDGILELGKFTKGDKIIDLGCGDGRIIRRISFNGVKCVIGYEFSFPTFVLARIQNYLYKSRSKVYFKNLWKQDYSEYDVLICFLSDNAMMRFEKNIWPKLKKGTRVISNEFQFKNIKAVRKKGYVYLYKKNLEKI